MKPVAAGLIGAILAAGVVFISMRHEPPQQVVQTTSLPQQLPTAAAADPDPSSPAVGSSPVTAKVDPPRAERRPARREQPAAKPASKSPAPKAQPETVAQNTPSQTPPQQPAQQPQPDSGGLVWNPPAPPADAKVVEEKKPERVPQTVTIPAGTLLSIRIDQALSTSTNQTGDSFRASLDQPLVIDGAVIAERGARVEGRVVESDPGGRVKGVSSMSLELVRLNTADGQRLRLQTEPFAKQGQQQRGRDAAKIGAAAGIGAAIGAIAGGGKGAAIGAAAGGAAGAGGVAATRGAAAEIPAETRMTFRLRDPITVTEKL